MKKKFLIFISTLLCLVTHAQVLYEIDGVSVSTFCNNILSLPVIEIGGRLANIGNDDEYLSIRYGNKNICEWDISILTVHNQKEYKIPYISPGGIGNYLPEYSLNFAGFNLAYSVLYKGQQIMFPMSTYYDKPEGQDCRGNMDTIISALQVDIIPDVKDSIAYGRLISLLHSSYGKEEYEICPMYNIKNPRLLQFINKNSQGGFEKGFCTVRLQRVNGIWMVAINYYKTPLFSKTDLKCLKKCLGAIRGTSIPAFIVDRSSSYLFEKGQETELHETWLVFKKMVRDARHNREKDSDKCVEFPINEFMNVH